MFRALNTELEDIRNKVELEQCKLKQFYDNCLENSKFKEYFTFKIIYEENSFAYETGRSNLMYHYIKRNEIEEIEKDNFNFFDYKHALFAFIKKTIERKQFKKAQKYLNVAVKREWFSFAFLQIQDELNISYYNLDLDDDLHSFVYKLPS